MLASSLASDPAQGQVPVPALDPTEVQAVTPAIVPQENNCEQDGKISDEYVRAQMLRPIFVHKLQLITAILLTRPRRFVLCVLRILSLNVDSRLIAVVDPSQGGVSKCYDS